MSAQSPVIRDSAARRGKLRRGLLLVLSALVVWLAIFFLLDSGSPPATPLGPSLTDRQGHTFPVSSFAGKIWVVSLVRGDCAGGCAEVLTALGELRDELPASVGFLSLTLPTLDGSLSVALEELPWTVLRGNLDSFRALTVDYLMLHASDLLAVEDGIDAALLATVGPAGRVHRTYRTGESGGIAAGDRDGIVADARFLQSLKSRPRLHAALNALSAALIATGFFFVRRKSIRAHVTCMLLAVAVTLGFLVSYLQYHHHTGSSVFQGEGLVRSVYLTVLLSHTVLAAFVVPLVGVLLFHAVRRRFDRHRRLARWTLPIWLYVSITGVLVYFMLYVWFPGG